MVYAMIASAKRFKFRQGKMCRTRTTFRHWVCVAVAAYLAAVALPVRAEAIGVRDDVAMTYTITVGQGATVTISAEDAFVLTNDLGAAYTFVKAGPGTLSVGSQIQGFAGRIVITNGVYEATTSHALGAGGEGAETFVRTGASLRLAHESNTKDSIWFRQGEVISIAGTGFDDAGALYNGLSQQQCVVLRSNGDLVLDDDATIKGSAIGFNGNCLRLNGHTLTVDMQANGTAFNNTFSSVATAGNIHVVKGRLFFEDALSCASGDESVVTIDKDCSIAFRGSTRPILMSLVLEDGANIYPSSPKYDAWYDNNVWSGPVTLNGSVTVNYSGGATSVAFTGPVSGVGRFSVNNENKLHLSCPSNTFEGGVRVVGSSRECLLSVNGGNALPLDGGNLYVQTGTVSLDPGVLALPSAEFNTSGSSVLSNTVPGYTTKIPSLVKNGTGFLVLYGGVEITNTLTVATGKVEIAGFAANVANAPGLYRYSTNFTSQADMTSYFSTVGITVKKAMGESGIRGLFDHVLSIREDNPVPVDGVDMAFIAWTAVDKWSLHSYTGYFRNLAPTNVTITFALSNWDIEGLWIDGNSVIYNCGTLTLGGTTTCIKLKDVVLAPGAHKLEILLGHFTSGNPGPRPTSVATMNWPEKHGFAMRFGAFDSVTNFANGYMDVMNGTPLGTILTRFADPLPADLEASPEKFRPTFANLAGAGSGTLDLGGMETVVNGLDGTLAITNGTLTVSNAWTLTRSQATAAPLTVSAGATLAFDPASTLLPDDSFRHGGGGAKVIAQTAEGGTFSGLPKYDTLSWTVWRTESDGITRLMVEKCKKGLMIVVQ